MISLEFAAHLACPNCPSAPLRVESLEAEGPALIRGNLHCANCESDFPIKAGIPDLIPSGVLSEADWKLWRDHLAGFEARRAHRLERRDQFLTKVTNNAGTLHAAFAKFTGIKDGVVLDVGCGPGNFRHFINEDRVTYVGIDPLPLEETEEFPFARAIAEYLPFQNGFFTDVIVMSAMDHFQDVPAFCREVIRVSKPGGRLHLVQSVHDVSGPLTAIKALAHLIKDYLESSATTKTNADAPKHMTEYGRKSLHQALLEHFEISAEGKFSKRWYSPENVFLTLSPKDEPASHAETGDRELVAAR